ncbi:hypothetical protein GQ42DRAFT_126565 [Ramicandelaber brevisporus]|nr:hypothetical protein GQ42DRAFT_126565 [Ramicandelaber brevisporus]
MSGLLPTKSVADAHKKTLVLDLDETLVHSTFMEYHKLSHIITHETVHNYPEGYLKAVLSLIRPGAREFLERMSKKYELVIFTAGVENYARPVVDKLDRNNVIKHRLYRDSCTHVIGGYLKDLNSIGRSLNKVILVDNAPTSYFLQPTNGLPIETWLLDQADCELYDVARFLEEVADVEDVRDVIDVMDIAEEHEDPYKWLLAPPHTLPLRPDDIELA